ncbi:MAG: hypothetical protein J7L77_08785 [Clostridiales bacterium]|nr:hypothetical protein [Clostridiales bacterium]
MKVNRLLPVEVVFTPNWWHKNLGIKFDRSFFFDSKRRIEEELKMRNYLYERFHLGEIGDAEKKERPVAGPVHLTAGFIIPQMFGCQVNFHDSEPPDVIPLNLNDEDILKLQKPDILNTYPMNELIKMMDELEDQYGYVEGDFDWNGVLNHALDIRGQQVLIDMYEESPILKHLFNVIYETMIDFTKYIISRTGTTSIAVNRQMRNFSPSVNLHSNCSVTMISNEMYEKYLLEYDIKLSKELPPYGIHHCGNNMEVVAPGYKKVENAVLFDVGAGSDIVACRNHLPDAFFNLRLDPVKLLTYSKEEVRKDIINMVNASGDIEKSGICCINIDSGTKDENILEIYKTVQELRKNSRGSQ